MIARSFQHHAMFDFIKNNTIYSGKYKTDSEAIVISCFFNPQNSPYRTEAFNLFYESIRHLNHRIIECVIGDTKPQLPENEHIKRIYTQNLLWHKETLLNKIVSELPKKYKYVFWIDADVIFNNLNWMTEGVQQLKKENIVQPFEYCVHLDEGQPVPPFGMDAEFANLDYQQLLKLNAWRSFCSNYANRTNWESENYNEHGHVGFAWGARREVLEAMPLYDKALIGGADHIIAHAAAGQVGHSCIAKSFTDNIHEVNDWSRQFYRVVAGRIGYVKGTLYHIWHGDIHKRDYLNRVRDFTARSKNIVDRDENGLFTTNHDDDEYMREYFRRREAGGYSEEWRRQQQARDKQRREKEASDKSYRREEEHHRSGDWRKQEEDAARKIHEQLRSKYPHQDDAFINSLLYAYMTDSAIIGAIIGGSLTGALIGDLLNDSDERRAALSEDEHKPSPESGDHKETQGHHAHHPDPGHTPNDQPAPNADSGIAVGAAAAAHILDSAVNEPYEHFS